MFNDVQTFSYFVSVVDEIHPGGFWVGWISDGWISAGGFRPGGMWILAGGFWAGEKMAE